MPLQANEISPNGAGLTPPVVVLAPMAGVTDAAVRALGRRFGATETVGEMLHSAPRLRSTTKGRTRAVQRDEPSPRIVQLLGNDPAELAAAARHQVAQGAEIIDFNLGCPAKKVCRKAAGSALLVEPDLVRACLEALVDAVDVPVSAKIRLGPRLDTINVETIASIAAAAGVQRLAVHARSRACAYRGPAHWALAAPAMPVTPGPNLINGDILDGRDAMTALADSGAQGVMIGRAALGQPWLLREIAAELAGHPQPQRPCGAERLMILGELLADIAEIYGQKAGARIARKHIDAFGTAAQREGLLSPAQFKEQRLGWIQADTIDEQRRHLSRQKWSA
ncbi:MAG: tRNA dihydrouridine synthase [Thioalkalivibrionaceae bacterium]